MTIESKDLLVAIKAYSRANPLPLDASEVHGSLEEAEAYAASAKAYPGQTVKVFNNGVYETYVLNPNKEGEGLVLGKVISHADDCAKLSDLGDYSDYDTVVDYVNAVVKSTSIEIVEF